MKNNTIFKSLSTTIINNIEANKIIYAEVSSSGAMGNSGGVMIYIMQNDNTEMICYETNIFDDRETYLLAEEKLFKHTDREGNNIDKELLYFDLYYGGMGNNVLINKKVNLIIQDNNFIYKAGELEFQIFSSVLGVFNSVVDQLTNKENSK